MRYKIQSPDLTTYQAVKKQLTDTKADIKTDLPRRFALSVEDITEDNRIAAERLGAKVTRDFQYEPDYSL